MTTKLYILLSAVAVASLAQKSFYAGLRPIGYPEMQITTTTPSSALANKIGEDDEPKTTTMRLPLEALGDINLVNKFNALPIDNRPFWLINWQALEAQRQRPLTYPLRPNGFSGQLSMMQF